MAKTFSCKYNVIIVTITSTSVLCLAAIVFWKAFSHPEAACKTRGPPNPAQYRAWGFRWFGLFLFFISDRSANPSCIGLLFWIPRTMLFPYLFPCFWVSSTPSTVKSNKSSLPKNTVKNLLSDVPIFFFQHFTTS